MEEQPNILIIDDEVHMCDLVKEGLSTEGYACATALNAEEAIQRMNEQDYKIIILDIRLPDMSGMELLRIMTGAFWDISVVIITAVNDLDNAVQAMKLGAVDYITKPFKLDRLYTIVSEILSIKNDQSWSSVKNNPCSDNRLFREMNAIAYGVEAEIDYFDFHSKRVTERTVEVARYLGIEEPILFQWITEREKYYHQRDDSIKSMLIKLEQNPIAQIALGLVPQNIYWGDSIDGLN